MTALIISSAVFVSLCIASFATMHFHPKLPLRHRDDDTNTVVRLVANIFVVMTSLVFGLMINSAKNTFENIDANVHSYATNLILLDRTLRTYGLGANDARQHLIRYVEEAIASPARADDTLRNERDTARFRLDMLGESLAAITPSDSFHESMFAGARQQYNRIVEQRWTIVEQSEGAIPMPLIGMLGAWLTLIFASFGYRAPMNTVVATMFLVSALLIAASVYLVLDMDIPFSGAIQISDAPLHRALAEMKSGT
ncbi:DUF4239 domain-containing protein [Sinorhizobium mexicanum]|uniref:DUF4239 domain-containing protein n=1 Tax=Sinorhizobium mexicanum TaxID=375549 RepID=A0A859QYE1_9HYPH|nr:DUF4239 domain-containing protein [Sinorhizobium mexicanum]MBP1887488.1 hypothetical protein [Sinorhizobium mexicanum]QLL62378.1 DUF4239 domain-containing protein [Sinorhizobium mexicanum]